MDKIKFKGTAKVEMKYPHGKDHIMVLPNEFYQDKRMLAQARIFRRLFEDFMFYRSCLRYGLRNIAEKDFAKAASRVEGIQFHSAFRNGYPRIFETVKKFILINHGFKER